MTQILNSKQRIVSVIALVLLTIIPVNAASFKDLAETNEHYAAIEYLKAKGILSGYPDGTFQPQKPINRAEALKMLLLAIKSAFDSKTELKFPDVAKNDWFYDYVAKGFDLKIVEGYPDTTFKPENNINLAESLKIISLSFQLPVPPKPLQAAPYADVARDVWYADYVQYAKDKQFIAARDDGNLHPELHVSRGEFAEIVYRLLYVREKKLENFPLNTNWPVFTHPTEHYSLKYPFEWTKIVADTQTIFWKRDAPSGQVSFARVFPNSATVVVAVDPNTAKLSLENYLAKISYDAAAVKQKLVLNGYPFSSIAIPASGLKDFYFELPNKTILIVYSQTGSGALQPQLEEEIRYLVGSIRYSEQGGQENKETLLSDIRQNLLTPGKGKTAIKLLPDAIIIETDTIGIGTGPVDYYYSAKYDVTVKYERNSDVLLAMKTARVTAF